MICAEQLSQGQWKLGWKVVSTSPPATDNVMAVNIPFILLNYPRGRALSPRYSAASQAPAFFYPSFSFSSLQELSTFIGPQSASSKRTRLSSPESSKIDYSGDRITFVQFLKGMFAFIYSGGSGSKTINLDHHFKLKSNFRGLKSGAATWQQAHGIKKQGLSEVKYFLRVRGYNNLGSNRIGQELLYS